MNTVARRKKSTEEYQYKVYILGIEGKKMSAQMSIVCMSVDWINRRGEKEMLICLHN